MLVPIRRSFQPGFVVSLHSKIFKPDHRPPGNGSHVIYAHDLSGNFTFLNKQGELLLGYSCEEARHMNIAEIVAPELAPKICEQILKTVTKRIGAVYEIEVIARNGQRVPLEVSMNVVFRTGQPAEIEGIAVPATKFDEVPAITPRCLDTEFFYRSRLNS
jgi:PAS domain S-box-containing protein